LKVKQFSAESLINGIKKGDIVSLSKAITYIESENINYNNIASEVINNILPYTGNSIRIGLSGVPGVGKSTFIESFGNYLLLQGKKVAVLAIDPSSQINKGSILGDKTRMDSLSKSSNAFIRPSATGNTLGGIAAKTRENILLCEAAGFDVIIVETVGVGQSETAVHQLTDCFLLLMLSGAGDELQGVKRGIMEIADIIYITKADGDNEKKAKQKAAEINMAVHYHLPHENNWKVKVDICSAISGLHIENVWKDILEFKQQSEMNNYWENNRIKQDELWFDKLIDTTLLKIMYSKYIEIESIEKLKQSVKNKEISIFSALQHLRNIFQ
jgi:LAO/AO transport system kinase